MTSIQKKLLELAPALAIIAIVIVIWHTVTSFATISPIFLPSPLKVAGTLLKLVVNGELAIAIIASVWRVLAGFIVSVLIALPLALAINYFPMVHRAVSPLLHVSKYLPVVAFIPLTILWLGIGDESKVFLLALGTTPYLTSLIVNAIERIPSSIIETAYTMGLSKMEMTIKIIIPYAAPNILEAMRISIAVAWTYLVVAELVAAPTGLGHLIVQSQRYLQTDAIFVGIITISLIGVITDYAFQFTRKVIFPWEEGISLEKASQW